MKCRLQRELARAGTGVEVETEGESDISENELIIEGKEEEDGRRKKVLRVRVKGVDETPSSSKEEDLLVHPPTESESTAKGAITVSQLKHIFYEFYRSLSIRWSFL